MLGRLLMEDSIGRSGDPRHQSPRTRARAVPQHAQGSSARARRSLTAAGTVMPKRAARSCIGNSSTSRIMMTLSQERRNSSDLGIQDLEHLSLTKFALGVGTRCGSDGSVSALGIGVIQLDELSTAPLTDKHEALVLDDPQQPGGEFCFSMELIDVLECLPACVLRFFFPFAVVAEDGCGQVYASTSMTENQFVERFSITLLCPIDQLLVRRNGITKSIHAWAIAGAWPRPVTNVSVLVSVKSKHLVRCFNRGVPCGTAAWEEPSQEGQLIF